MAMPNVPEAPPQIPYESTDRVPPGEMRALELLLAAGLGIDPGELVIYAGHLRDNGAVAVFARHAYPGSREIRSWFVISYDTSKPLEAPWTEWDGQDAAVTHYQKLHEEDDGAQAPDGP